MNDRNREERLTALDQGFKTIVHDSDVLSWLIRSNVDEFKDKTIEEIKSCLNIGEDGRTVIGRENEYDSPVNGRIVTDSIFDVKVPGTDEEVSVIVNLEEQYDPNPGYPLEKRAEYYMARLVSSQKGVVFSNDDYGRLRKVYSIWIILDPKSENRNTVTRYSMAGHSVAGDPKRKMPLLETFNIVFINVGRYDSSLPDVTAFPAVLFSRMSIDERQELMSEKFNISLNDAMNREVDNMASMGEDAFNYGFREGVKEGIKKEKIDMIVRLIKMNGNTMNEAMSIVDVPENMAEEIEKEVRKRLDSDN